MEKEIGTDDIWVSETTSSQTGLRGLAGWVKRRDSGVQFSPGGNRNEI